MATSPISDPHDTAIDAHSRSALASTRRNLRYLYNPSTAPGISSRRTRTVLRLLRSSLIFAFWRIVRYAKYVAVGSLVATLGAGVFGTVVSGAGFVLAPTGVVGTLAAAGIWGVGRFAVRKVRRRWGAQGGMGGEEREEVHREWSGPEAMSW